MKKFIAGASNLYMPWKNGQGSTAQIDIFPAEANISEMNFDYRLSSAKVSAAGPFSRFPGFDRLLCVIEGEALRINGYRHEAYEPFAFKGEEEIYAALYGLDVVDLGIIFRRDKYSAQMRVLDVVGSNSHEVSGDVCFVYCAGGSVQVGADQLTKGDALKMEPGELLNISSDSSAKLIVIELLANIF